MKWHQDIQFWPHTNYSPLTVGVFLDDVEPDMGMSASFPAVIAASSSTSTRATPGRVHLRRRPGSRGRHACRVPGRPAGSVTVHNCRTVHGSAPNRSDRERPLLLQTYSAADAFPYTDIVRRSPHGDVLIRGNPARWARHDPRPCQVGPAEPRRSSRFSSATVESPPCASGTTTRNPAASAPVGVRRSQEVRAEVQYL